MNCISDPNLNSEFSSTSMRPLSCPNRSSFLTTPSQLMMKYEPNFDLNLERPETMNTFDPHVDFSANSEKIIKNIKSAENMLFYQCSSQTSFPEFPYFHNKDTFETENASLLVLFPSPGNDELTIQYNKHSKPFGMWGNKNSKKSQSEMLNQHNNGVKWDKCCQNDWFEQHEPEQRSCCMSCHHCNSCSSCHQSITNSNSKLNINDFPTHSCLHDSMYVPCFNTNFVCSCCAKKMKQCRKEIVKNVDDDFSHCTYKEALGCHRCKKRHSEESQLSYVPVSNQYNCPDKPCHCSMQHNPFYSNCQHSPFFDCSSFNLCLDENTHNTHHSPFNHQSYNSHHKPHSHLNHGSPCYCSYCPHPLKTDSCMDIGSRCNCMKNKQIKKEHLCKCLNNFVEKSITESQNRNSEKESWTVKYRKYMERQAYRKLGLCLNCGKNMLESKRVSKWKKCQTFKPKIGKEEASERYIPKAKHNAMNDKVMTNTSKKLKKYFKKDKFSFEMIRPQSPLDPCFHCYYPNLSSIRETNSNSQDIDANHINEFTPQIHDFSSYISTEKVKNLFEPKKGSISANSKCLTNKLIKDKNFVESLPTSYLSDKLSKNTSKNSLELDKPSSYHLLNPNQTEDSLKFNFHDKKAYFKGQNSLKPPSFSKCQNLSSHKSHANKFYLGSASPMLEELNFIEEETKKIEEQLMMAIFNEKSLTSNLQQQTLQKNLKTVETTRKKLLKLGKMSSQRSEKVEKIIKNSFNKSSFIKSCKDKETNKITHLLPKDHARHNQYPQRYVIHKPNFRPLQQQEPNPKMTFLHSLKQNNHHNYQQDNPESSPCQFCSHNNISTDPQQCLPNYVYSKTIQPHQCLPPFNFCNHSHNSHLTTNFSAFPFKNHNKNTSWYEDQNYKFFNTLDVNETTEELNYNQHCGIQTNKMIKHSSSMKSYVEETSIDLTTWKEIYTGHPKQD